MTDTHTHSWRATNPLERVCETCGERETMEDDGVTIVAAGIPYGYGEAREGESLDEVVGRHYRTVKLARGAVGLAANGIPYGGAKVEMTLRDAAGWEWQVRV